MEKVTARTGIYHEHQQGALCAQHALNNLLQSEIFSADTLAVIARELDVEESSVLRNALRESENVDDTGFFNIQVLQRALKMFEIDLVPFESQEPIAQEARERPDSIRAFICNFGAHWFAVRRFANQYFDLNSMYYVPDLIPVHELPYALSFMKQNRYSVFIVHGTIPECLADQQLRANPITQQEYLLFTKDLPKLIMDGKVMGGPNDKIRNGRLVVTMPPDLMYEFEKNPNNPEIRAKIQAVLPKGVSVDDIIRPVAYAKPQQQQQHPPTLATPVREHRAAQQVVTVCDCPRCRRQNAITPKRTEERLIDDTNIDQLNESLSRQQMMIDERKIDASNPLSAQKRVVTSALLITRGRQRILLLDEQRISPTLESNSEMENEDDYWLQQAINQSLLDESNANDEANDSLISQQIEEMHRQSNDRALAMSLYASEIQQSMERSIGQTRELRKSAEEIRELDRKMLETRDLGEKIELIRELRQKADQFRELMLATSMDAELAAIQASSSSPPLLSLPLSTKTTIAAHSPPSTSTDVPLPTNTYSPSPNASLSAPPNTPSSLPTSASIESSTTIPLPSSTKTDSSLPVVVNPPTPTITDSILITTELPLSTKTDSSLPVVVNPPTPTITDSIPVTAELPPSTPASPNVVESPSVEELRLRHLQNTGRRHRSIISVQSNSDD